MKSKSKRLPVKQLEAQEQLLKAYKAFFKSSNGRIVLKDLSKRFYDVDLSTNSEHTAQLKVGRHSVVYYIKRLMSAGEEL